MIADWDIPVSTPASSGNNPQVAAIVPLPDDLGGVGEILVLSAFGNMRLPAGDIQPRETSMKAVARVVLGGTGLRVTPERLVYIVEQAGKPLTLCVLCNAIEDETTDTKPGVRFANLAASDGEFDPAPLRELLIEDIRAGFVRGVAHVAVSFDSDGQSSVAVNW